MIRTIRKVLGLVALLLAVPMCVSAQIDTNDSGQFNQMNPDGTMNTRNRNMADSLGTDKEVPRGIKVWTVDSKLWPCDDLCTWDGCEA